MSESSAGEDFVNALGPTTPHSGRSGTDHGEAPDGQHERGRWMVLVIVSIAQLMIVLDISIVNIALPDAQKALGFSNGDRQWIVTAYSLAFGALLLFGGRLADLVGRKRMFIAGLIVFAAASLLGGISPNFEVLVTARAIQGVAGATLAPAALSLLTTTFPDSRERATAFAVFGAVAGSGAAVGLLLGGVLTEFLSWRWTLFINVLFAGVALIGAVRYLTRERPHERPGLDIPGTLLVSVGLFCLVYGFSNAESHPWSAPSTWGFIVVGGVLLLAFCAWIARAADPLLPPWIVLHRDRGGSFLAMFITGAGIFGVFLFLTYFLQTSLRYSPVRTGLAFLPLVIALMITATAASTRLLPRFGPKLLIPPGMMLAAGGMAWLTGISLTSSYAANILGPLILLGAGLGLVFAPALNSATFSVGPRDAGVASATANTAQQVGGSIGTALLNTIAASAVTSYVASHAAAHVPPTEVQAQAAVHSYQVVFWICAAIFAIGALICFGLLRFGAQQPDSQAADAPAAA
ncbi:DHA2 family efflux MFS transporter permease subunit [Actinospica durhamensis]|uniref:DHA2 family efflux MFS transporter permease subunit n=1 Tax=Actinospica durhamensis TaxID=1508375 RepID=A0A941ENC0_9ACTN|nr:MFS transporter [Actinospica durhamensis]MBR7834231.1 DHA2 family efflux MFS transporter permease subunit [Actinospica durhamensis]